MSQTGQEADPDVRLLAALDNLVRTAQSMANCLWVRRAVAARGWTEEVRVAGEAEFTRQTGVEIPTS